MILNYGLHLAYCTNIHRGDDWPQTFDSLQRCTLAVRDRVSSGQPYAIGLRLSAKAARTLSDPTTLRNFRQWLDAEHCYVFSINGFPYGQFHGTRVKEQVYQPDWTTRERLDYTNCLFDILAQLVPDGVEGSVSTVPCSFKEFIKSDDQVDTMRVNLWRCVEHIAAVSQRSGRKLHLGLEPEPLCLLETSAETVLFFEALRAHRPDDDRVNQFLGVNYDTCHLAAEYEDPQQVVGVFEQHKIKLSKIHLSSALKVRATAEVRRALAPFADDTYFHQVIERCPAGKITRYRDLDVALAQPPNPDPSLAAEWRIHFHIPLHSRPTPLFDNTTDHILGLLDLLKLNPALCSHLEMETYTWEVMPPEMKNRSVIEQLVGEYDWTLAQLRERGLA
jgi:hypothetical protein